VVTTSKFTLLSFLPLALREQFRRLGNVYFLFMGCLMALGYYTDLFVSAVSPWTTLGPLAVVVSVSLVQEGRADLARHRADRATNERKVDVIVLSPTPNPNPNPNPHPHPNLVRSQTRWKDLRVGQVVYLANKSAVPADCVLLAVGGTSGSAYVETAAIDGETNLKLRETPRKAGGGGGGGGGGGSTDGFEVGGLAGGLATPPARAPRGGGPPPPPCDARGAGEKQRFDRR